jgi:hypothetical protein
MYATAILRGLFEPMNSDLSQYITIHRSECSISKIITSIYTIDDFPICHYIHRQLSPSISVH